jgi:hypothetical protein
MKLLITEEQYKYLSNNSISNDINGKLPLIKTFVNFCKDDLCIKRKIKVILTDDKSKTKTFAHFSPAENSLTVYVKNRHIGDILRSIAHELKHFQQKLNGELTPSSGEDGSPEENEANSFAGVMMRKFGKIRPEIFENYNPSKKKLFEEVLKKMSLAEMMHHYYEYGDIDGIKIPPLENEKFEWLFNQMQSMIDELRENNIDTGEILNVSNWGLKPNGDLAIFDIGFGNYFDSFDEEPEEFTLNEEYDFMDKIFEKLGITDYKHLGGGMFGHAYDIGGNKVLKVTKDETEAINSKKIKGKNLNHIANIYEIKTLNLDEKYYIIILEKLKEAQKELEKLFTDLENYFYSYNSEHFDKSIINGIKNEEAVDFLKDIFKYGKGVWDKWRERMKESEGEIDFNDLYDLSTWIKGSPTNNNDVTDEPPSYIKDEILDSIT